MTKIIIAILAVWLLWAAYQYATKSETAYTLVQQTIEEIDSLDTDTLLQRIDKGFVYKEVNKNGKMYWIHWIIKRANTDTASSEIKAIEVRGRVDFIELLPFTDLRWGSPFKLVINIKRE